MLPAPPFLSAFDGFATLAADMSNILGTFIITEDVLDPRAVMRKPWSDRAWNLRKQTPCLKELQRTSQTCVQRCKGLASRDVRMNTLKMSGFSLSRGSKKLHGMAVRRGVAAANSISRG